MSGGTHPVAALLLEAAFLFLMFLFGNWLLTSAGDDETGRQEVVITSSASAD
jgi:hypothetical protein